MRSKSNCVLLRQIGKFVNAFDEDALIVNYLLDYKLSNGKIGFPSIILPKVINVLEDNHISYEIKGTLNDTVMNYKNRNKYNYVLEKAILKKKTNDRIYSINDKLPNLNEKKLDQIISFIEEIINEK